MYLVKFYCKGKEFLRAFLTIKSAKDFSLSKNFYNCRLYKYTENGLDTVFIKTLSNVFVKRRNTSIKTMGGYQGSCILTLINGKIKEIYSVEVFNDKINAKNWATALTQEYINEQLKEYIFNQ